VPFRAAFRTLGCKLNQLETEAMAAGFRDAGATTSPFAESADVYVVNTCTVTGKAEQKARREIRKALRTNPQAVVLVTGCWAELAAQEVSALGPRTVVIPGGRKDDVALLACDLAEAWEKGLDLAEAAERGERALTGRVHDPFAFRPENFLLHSRASLKIQDGCDNRCAYCRVCLARGKSCSLDPERIVERARDLADRGAAEIVLTGVNLTQYRAAGLRMGGLLDLLARETQGVSYRLSSWEPDWLDDEFLAAFASNRVRAHMHLAIQSGCDATLARMGRKYRSGDVREAVRKLRQVKGDLFLGADVITGFPGETDDEFRQTLALFEELDFAWLHAFPFSPRPGTKAFGMKPKIPERVAGERVETLLTLGRAGRTAYTRRALGRTTRAVLEFRGEDLAGEEAGDVDGEASEIDAAEGVAGGLPADAMEAVSDEYLRLAVTGVPASLRRRGAEISCRITAPFPGTSRLGEPDAFAEFWAL
jgi:threonylcarbamoyladenosine tRNA methylthiotransferase MtaB